MTSLMFSYNDTREMGIGENVKNMKQYDKLVTLKK